MQKAQGPGLCKLPNLSSASTWARRGLCTLCPSCLPSPAGPLLQLASLGTRAPLASGLQPGAGEKGVGPHVTPPLPPGQHGLRTGDRGWPGQGGGRWPGLTSPRSWLPLHEITKSCASKPRPPWLGRETCLGQRPCTPDPEGNQGNSSRVGVGGGGLRVQGKVAREQALPPCLSRLTLKDNWALTGWRDPT